MRPSTTRPENFAGHVPALIVAVALISIAHVVETALYGTSFLVADRILGLGTFEQADNLSWMDYFYSSLVNFTTLGRGDLTPIGHLRLITGIEAFNGFLLITASGSFLLQTMGGKAPLENWLSGARHRREMGRDATSRQSSDGLRGAVLRW